MLRIPTVNPDVDRRIADLEGLLKKLELTPEHRRIPECVQEKQECARELLDALKADLKPKGARLV